jgi:glycerol-3-phosphate acyltransferase PlsX
MFVGLGGICVKSHGGTDEIGFANAVSVSVELMAGDFQTKIAKAIADNGHLFGLETDGSDKQ